MNVMLLHGWGGSDFPHWQSWLAGEIAKEYGCVDFFRFPNVDAPVLDVWKEAAIQELRRFRPDVLVCHSLANTLWFHLCNEGLVEEKLKELFLVAPPSLECSIEELQTFFPVSAPEDLHAKRVHLIVSDNDPYMQKEEAKQLAQVLDVEPIFLKNAGHINAQSGFGPWPWMLQQVLKKDRDARND